MIRRAIAAAATGVLALFLTTVPAHALTYPPVPPPPNVVPPKVPEVKVPKAKKIVVVQQVPVVTRVNQPGAAAVQARQGVLGRTGSQGTSALVAGGTGLLVLGFVLAAIGRRRSVTMAPLLD